MIAHDPTLVILSITIAILGAFTSSVMTPDLGALPPGEVRIRITMAAVTLGASIWATQFAGLLAIVARVNVAYNPLALGLSAVTAFTGTAAAMFLLRPKRGDAFTWLFPAVSIFGGAIAATNYLGLIAIAGRGLELSWFLSAICVAFSVQIALMALWFFFKPRGVFVTLLGSTATGLGLAAAHYLAVASTSGLRETLQTIPQNSAGISSGYLAWAAAIMTYLICSICLSVFVIMQFREEIE